MRSGIETQTDLIIGAIGILLVLEATRRMVGPALSILAGVFIIYAMVGTAARHIEPPGLHDRAHHRAAMVHGQWHLRHTAIRLGHLRHRLHPLRLVPEIFRCRGLLYQPCLRANRLAKGRTRKDIGPGVGVLRHDIREFHRQCSYRRVIHHTADEKGRLP